MSTPAERLNAAAQRLRDLAGSVSGGPWQAAPSETASGYCVHDGGFEIAFGMERPDAAFIAAMHPGVALALAELLAKAAWMVGLDPDLAARVGVPEALAIADLVLAGDADDHA